MSQPAAIDRSATVARIVLDHPETAAVFQSNRIDFCCRGNVSVHEACKGIGKEPEALFAELETAVGARTGAPVEEDLRTFSTPALLARIVDRHHGYLRSAVPRIEPLLAKVATVHGELNPKLAGVRSGFGDLVAMLGPHLDFEEEVLFPELARPAGPLDGALAHLDAMNAEHLAVGTKLAEIRAFADDFTTPGWGCNSYRALMAELQNLEADILRHVHLENHVLMPRFTGTAAPAA